MNSFLIGVPNFEQAARVPTKDAAAIIVLTILALAVLAGTALALKRAPAFNPVELGGPKDHLD